MKYLFVRYKKNLYLFLKYELLRIQYKYIFWNTNLPFFIRSEAYFNLSSLGKLSSYTKLKNFCFLSKRTKSVFKLFHMSRFSLKIMQYKGNILGLKKNSK